MFVNIYPKWVKQFNHVQFINPLPFLDLSFFPECIFSGMIFLKPYQFVTSIFRSKTIENFLLMLLDPCRKVVRMTCVEGAVWFIGADISVEHLMNILQ